MVLAVLLPFWTANSMPLVTASVSLAQLSRKGWTRARSSTGTRSV